MHLKLFHSLNSKVSFLSYRLFSNADWLGCYDVVIIGSGIVGMATAKYILEKSNSLTCAVIEKESDLAQHQSGHNSGVIHAGIYYKPGSLKAKLCTEGMNLAYRYLDAKQIPYKKVGKLIVATDLEQLPLLDNLYARGKENNVADIRMLNSDEIKEVEPHCCGLKAIHSPNTGIVDWGLVTRHYAEDFKNRGGDIHYSFNVCKFEYLPESQGTVDINKYPVSVTSTSGKTINAGYVLSCAGLYADQLAAISGGQLEPAIIPVRGEYLLLNEDKHYLIKGNIYPVPNPKFPFLGVHFTPKVDGSIWLGPNAVLAFKREGYTYSDISSDELLFTLRYKGFQKLALNNLNFGLKEFIKSIYLPLQIKELKKFIPEISLNDVRRGPSGVRAQAVSSQGELVDDFVFENSGQRILHCRNAPSPAATSSLAIGRVVSEKVLKQIEALN